MQRQGFLRPYRLIALGCSLLGLAVLWQFGLSARWTQRIPPAWSWQADFIGATTFPDPTTNQFPTRDTIGIYARTIQARPSPTDANAVLMEDIYTTRDINTGQKTYEYQYQAAVDAQTGAHLAAAYRGDFFVFPRQVEKQTYTLRFSYLKGIPVTYQGEDRVEGLLTYRFAYKGRGEYSESYAGSTDYPGIALKPGQEIKCADDQFSFKVWVEPVTGEIVKVDESCLAGDYVFAVANGQALFPVMRWAGVTAGDDVIRRSERIRQARTHYLWTARYLPLLLWATGLMALSLGVIRRQAARR
jgi:hypothetical protein